MVLRTNLLAFLLLSLCCLYFVGATEPDDNDYVTGIKEGDIEDDDDDLKKSAKPEEAEAAPEERPLYIRPKVVGFAHFAEPFDNEEEFKKKWVLSQAKKDGAEEAISKYDGKWELAEAEINALQGDLSLVLQSRAKHHAISSKLQRVFDFSGKPLILQYEVKLQLGIECGGAYIKLLTQDNLDLEQFHDKTPYTIMFGPDKCGLDYKLHFIFRHKNLKTGEITEKHAKKPTGSIENYFTDKSTHLYQLVINPDNTFKITIDGNVVSEGNLLEDMTPPVNPPKEIEDEKDEKPKDWDDKEKIPDPEATKPDDWDEDETEKIVDPDAEKPEGWLDNEPENIPDPDAEKPSDWDDDMDGEWEAPLITNPKCKSAPGCGEWKPGMIDNPKYKGKWRAPMIDNHDYQGVWKPRMIPNPNFFEDLNPYKMMPIAAVGFELWSMTERILFDNILITDNMATATKWTEDTFNMKLAQEKSSSSAKSVIQAILDVTNERPWLWAVFIVVVLLPIVLLIAYCCVGGGAKICYLMDLPGRIAGYAEKNRWVYLVYVMIIFGPVIAMSLYIMPKGNDTEDDIGERKKTDALSPDDSEPKKTDALSPDDSEPKKTDALSPDDSEPIEDAKAPKSTKKKENKPEEENKDKKEEIDESKSKKPSKGDLEAEKETENADVSEDEEEVPKVERRRRLRKD